MYGGSLFYTDKDLMRGVLWTKVDLLRNVVVLDDLFETGEAPFLVVEKY